MRAALDKITSIRLRPRLAGPRALTRPTYSFIELTGWMFAGYFIGWDQARFWWAGVLCILAATGLTAVMHMASTAARHGKADVPPQP